MKRIREKLPSYLFWGAPLIALSLPLLPLLLSSQFALFYRDLGSLVLLKKQIWRDSVLQFGELPLWNHWVLGGTPYLADPASGAYSPFNLFFLFFHSIPYALSWSFLFLLALIFLCSYFLFRKMGAPKSWGIFLALVLSSGGTAFSYVYIPDYLGSFVGALLFLLSWQRYMEKGLGNYRWLFISSLCLTIPAYSSDPQTSYIFMLFFAPLILALEAREKIKRKILAWVELAALSALAFSAQLVPALDQLGGTLRDPRQGGLVNFEAWSLHPARLLEWLVSLPFGTEIYSGAKITRFINGPNPAPLLMSYYCGVLFLPLLLASLPAIAKNIRARSWLIFGFIALLLSFGSYSPLPLNFWLGKALPLWSSFRYPERLFIFSLLALLMSMATVLGEEQKSIFRRLTIIFPVTLAAALLLWLLQSMPGAGTSLLFGCLLLITIFFQARKPSALWAGTMLIIAALDLSFTSAQIIFPAPSLIAQPSFSPYSRFLSETPEAKKASLLPARYFMESETNLNWELLNRLGPSFSTYDKLTVHAFLMLQLNIAPYLGFPASFGFATVMNHRHTRLWEALAEQDFYRLVGLRGTKYLGVNHGGRYSVSILKKYTPYLWQPKSAWYASGDDMSLRLISSQNWPWTERLVVQPGSSPIEPFAHSGEQTPSADFSILRHSYSGLTAQLTAKLSSKEQWILWNESYSQNWAAFLDGREIPVAIGNYWATALLLPPLEAGRSYRLELKYQDPLVALGQSLVLLWLLLFIWVEYRARYHLLRPLNRD